MAVRLARLATLRPVNTLFDDSVIHSQTTLLPRLFNRSPIAHLREGIELTTDL